MIRARGVRRAFAALLALAACSGKALAPDGGQGGAGGAAGKPDGSTPETNHTDGPMEHADGGRCTGPADGMASIAVHAAGTDLLPCGQRSGFDSGTTDSWTGTVTETGPGSITLDTCVDDARCVPLVVEAHAPGLDLSSFPHVAVRVRAAARSSFYTCQQSLEITTADADGGAAGKLLLAVVDGGGTFEGSPYQVAHVKLDCAFGDGPTAGIYAFEFTGADGGPPLRVYMGETVPWTNDGATLKVRNLRSFESGNYDDYWNWAYWIYADPK
jgi:hypothetical protein